MGPQLTFNIPQFRHGSHRLAKHGHKVAKDLTSGVQSSLSPPGSVSPVGNQISQFTGQLQSSLFPAGPALSDGADGVNNGVQTGMTGIENQDGQNAEGFNDGTTPDGELDPDSIDQDAQDEAQDMLGGDKTEQMMQQLLQTGMQTGSQIAEQLSQQLSQIGSKLGEVVGKAGEQLGQLVSKAAESAKSAADVAKPDLGLDGLGGGFGGGGGGMDPGTTMPAGLETPVTPMNGSSALQASPLQGIGGGSPSAAAAASRMPMMPMMPMHGARGHNKDEKSTKRDPAIFPEDKLYDAPTGVEQTFGAIPEIEYEEPPFGTSGTQSSGH